MKNTVLKRVAAITAAAAMILSLAACVAEPAADEVADSAPETVADLLDYGDIAPAEANPVKDESGNLTYTLRALRYSHWYLDENGAMETVSEDPYRLRTEDKWYYYDKEISTADTAFLVMDPWIDWADQYLNDYFGAITAKTTLPLMQAAAEAGHKIIILTNHPDQVKYNTKIDLGLQALVDEGKAELLYHPDYPIDTFKAYLEEKGIKKLVYTGYCSNMCVMYRELGIGKMALSGGVELYFVPECSGAMEHADTWETQDVHKATTLVISQTQALLLRFDDIMNALKGAK